MSDNVKDVKQDKPQEADIPQSITKSWLEKKIAQEAPHLGIHETQAGMKGFYRIKGGIDATFTPVGLTWRAVAVRLGFVR